MKASDEAGSAKCGSKKRSSKGPCSLKKEGNYGAAHIEKSHDSGHWKNARLGRRLTEERTESQRGEKIPERRTITQNSSE